MTFMLAVLTFIYATIATFEPEANLYESQKKTHDLFLLTKLRIAVNNAKNPIERVTLIHHGSPQ